MTIYMEKYVHRAPIPQNYHYKVKNPNVNANLMIFLNFYFFSRNPIFFFRQCLLLLLIEYCEEFQIQIDGTFSHQLIINKNTFPLVGWLVGWLIDVKKQFQKCRPISANIIEQFVTYSMHRIYTVYFFFISSAWVFPYLFAFAFKK